MRKIITLLLLCSFYLSSAQVLDSIKMSPQGLPAVVVVVESKNANEIYSKVKQWVNRYYKNPDYVLKVDEKSSFLKVSGMTSFTYKNTLGSLVKNLDYTFTIDFKDGKYKIEFFNLKIVDFGVTIPDYFYKKNGNRRTLKEINRIQDGLMDSVNEIHFDIYNFINSENEDW